MALSGRGKTSGVQIGGLGAEVFEIHNRTVAKIVVYWERGHAFAGLGLAE
jgi:hypothetical protein